MVRLKAKNIWYSTYRLEFIEFLLKVERNFYYRGERFVGSSSTGVEEASSTADDVFSPVVCTSILEPVRDSDVLNLRKFC